MSEPHLSTTSPWGTVPDPVLIQVLSMAPKADCLNARLVCSGWYHAHARSITALKPAYGTANLSPARISNSYTNILTLDLTGLTSAIQGDAAVALAAALRGASMLQTLLLPSGNLVTFRWMQGIASGGRALTSLTLSRVQELCPWGLALLGTGLPKLTHLDVSHVASLEDEALAHLQPFANLRDLNLAGCVSLRSSGLRHLSSLPLSSLNVSGCPAASNVAGVLAMLEEGGRLPTTLVGLNISGSLPMADTQLAAISRLPRLATLRVSGRHGWSADGFSQLAQLPSLTELHADSCRGVTDVALAPLRSLQQLRLANLSHAVELTSRGLAAADGWTALTDLSLVGAMKVSDAAFTAHIIHRTSLVKLYLKNCPLVSDAGVAALRGLCCLEDVKLEEFPLVTDVGIVQGLSSMPKLKSLSLRKCCQLGDESMAAVCRNTALSDICISHCQVIGNAGLCATATLESLQHLDMKCVGQVSDEGVVALAAAQGKSLQTLRLGWCSRVTDQALEALAMMCPKLLSLELYRMSSITDSGIEVLQSHLPLLHIGMYKCAGVTIRDR